MCSHAGNGFLKQKGPLQSLSLMRALPLPSFFSSLLRLLSPSSFISFTRRVSQPSHSKNRQTCERCCVPEVLASRGPPCSPRPSSCSPSPAHARQPAGRTRHPRARSHKPPATTGDAAGQEFQHCKQNSSPTSCQPKWPRGELHLFSFSSLTFL